MVEVNAVTNLVITHRPAFYALLHCAEEIAQTHGAERAEEWARAILDADVGMFCRVEVDRRPALRLIQGGAS